MNSPIPADAIATLAEAPAVETTRLGHARLFAISAMPFAMSVVWGAVLTIIAPIQVEDILRRSGLSAERVTAQKPGALGLVVAAGAGMALVSPPFIGAFSDRTSHRLGGRRAFISAGTSGTIVGL